MSEEATISDEETIYVVDVKKTLRAAIGIVNELDPLFNPERLATIARVLITYYGQEGAIEFAKFIIEIIPQIVGQDSEFEQKAAELPNDET